MLGFNPTMVRFKLAQGFSTLEPETFVSIPRWFDSNRGAFMIPDTISQVSIPRWFDSNHRNRDRAIRDFYKFKSHDGSIQTGNYEQIHRTHMKFQSHDGSIQTKNFIFEELRRKEVSIPRWFDSNQALRGARSRALAVSIPRWFDSNRAFETSARRRL